MIFTPRNIMAQTIKYGIKKLVEDAEAEIETFSVQQALAVYKDEGAVFVDIRDIRELKREGYIPGAIHAPRGMLEFWVDPESPYYKDKFGQDKRYVLFCAGGLRSALATQQIQKMGMHPVCHIEGGFAAWRDAGGTIEKDEINHDTQK